MICPSKYNQLTEEFARILYVFDDLDHAGSGSDQDLLADSFQ